MNWTALLLAAAMILPGQFSQVVQVQVDLNWRLEQRMQTTAAVIRAGEDWWALSANGTAREEAPPGWEETCPQVLGLTAETPEAGEPLTVPQGEQEKLAALTELLEALEAREMLSKVENFIDLGEEDGIYFDYGPGLTVLVPWTGEVSRSVARLQKVEEALAEELTGTLDLTRGENKDP